MERITRILVSFLCVVACAILVWLVAFTIKAAEKELDRMNAECYRPDTVYIHDTIVIREPAPAVERILSYDTLRMEKAKRVLKDELKSELIDSTLFAEASKMLPDSVEVVAPRVQRRYDDSTCTVWVSGYDPQVDSVWTYHKAIYYPVVKEREAKPPKVVVSIGPYAGFGNKGANYGVAISVGIPIWSW